MEPSLWISVVAVTLSIISLGWQIISWKSSGARLRVRPTLNIPIGINVMPGDYPGITITNSGRASTVVEGASFMLPDKRHIPAVSDALGQARLPRELRPGESLTMHFAPDAIPSALHEAGLPHDTPLTPVATSGHGRARGKPLRLS